MKLREYQTIFAYNVALLMWPVCVWVIYHDWRDGRRLR